MTLPAVSVLLPVRDGGPWLGGSLASLARQTLAEIEVVAIDDGSRDGSGDLLDRWADHDRRIKVIHQRPLGLVDSLNRGLEHCRAPLVARMDADDVSHPRRLELQAGLLDERPDVGVVSCLVRLFPRRGIATGFRLYEAWLNSMTRHESMARERFIESPLAHPSAMVRRDVLIGAGGWRDADWPEDYDLWLRLFETGVIFAKVERFLFFWREHDARLTRTDDRYSVPGFLRCKARYLVSGPLAGCRRVVLWGAGRTGRRLSGLLLDDGVEIIVAVDIDPAKIGGTLRGIPVIPPEELPSHLSADAVVITAVASRGARQLIREHLVNLGLEEGGGFWCVA